MTQQAKRIVLALALLLMLAIVQITVVPLISLGGVVPSVLLIGTVFLSLREGQMTGMLVSFPAGVLVDAYFSGLVGITSLGLTIAAFAVGYFHDEEKAHLLIRSPRAVAIIFFGATLFHLAYVFAYFQSLDIRMLSLLGLHVLGASVYTTVLSTVPVLIIARRASRLKV
jgi:rod shape-determining protein MreD